MNREIKFRCWNITEGYDLVNGGKVPNGKPDGYMVYANDNLSCKCEDYGKLMQYTGLKDKNGVEIYEGDIVKAIIINGNLPNGDFNEEKHIGSIEWHNEALQMIFTPVDYNCILNYSWTITSGGYGSGDAPSYEMEVIGNIYDNPKLTN